MEKALQWKWLQQRAGKGMGKGNEKGGKIVKEKGKS